jgi:hypothetical protein
MATSTTARRKPVQRCSRPLRPLPDRPSRAVLDLGTLPTAPGCSRAWTRRILLEWQLTGLLDSAELIVSDSLNLTNYSFSPFWRCWLVPG